MLNVKCSFLVLNNRPFSWVNTLEMDNASSQSCFSELVKSLIFGDTWFSPGRRRYQEMIRCFGFNHLTPLAYKEIRRTCILIEKTSTSSTTFFWSECSWVVGVSFLSLDLSSGRVSNDPTSQDDHLHRCQRVDHSLWTEAHRGRRFKEAPWRSETLQGKVDHIHVANSFFICFFTVTQTHFSNLRIHIPALALCDWGEWRGGSYEDGYRETFHHSYAV